MSNLRLRYPNTQQQDLVLEPGVHCIGRDSAGRPAIVGDAAQAFAQFCVDRRGVWLQVREGARGLHVNGRPVRRMALLRAGDAVFVDGAEWLLGGETPPSAPSDLSVYVPESTDPRIVLRGVGGAHHGRSVTLDQPRLIGRVEESDIRIDEASFADRHARLEPHREGVVLRDVGSHDGSLVNGWPVRNALLRPGDQVVFDSHRFVVEAPRRAPMAQVPSEADAQNEAEDVVGKAQTVARATTSVRRMPWLLLAAVLLAGALSLLLVYGAR